MGNKDILDNLANMLGQNATIKKVYGDPIETKGKTIIPVAQVSFGLGGGQGNNKRGRAASDTGDQDNNEKNENAGSGYGGGGGVSIKPRGVYEITEQDSRFIPINQSKQLLAAGLIGFSISFLFFRRRKK